MRNNTKRDNYRAQEHSKLPGKSQRTGNRSYRSKSRSTEVTPNERDRGIGHDSKYSVRRDDTASKRLKTTPNQGRFPDWVTRYQSVYFVSRQDAARMLEISYPGCNITPVDVTDLLVMLDSWIALLSDLTDTDSPRPLVMSIINTGLQTGIVNLIKSADVSADAIIQAKTLVYPDVPYPWDGVIHRAKNFSRDLWMVLQVLRFPKRYSPSIAKRYYEDQTLKDYLDWDNRVGQLDQSHRKSIHFDYLGLNRYMRPYSYNHIKEPYGYIGMRLKAIIHDWLRDYRPQFIGCVNYDTAISRMMHNGIALTIPSGSTSDCGTNEVSKGRKLLASLSVPGIVDQVSDATFAEVICVNKNYKTPRTIAKEPMKRAMLQKVVRKELIHALGRNRITTSDTRNKNFPMFHFENQEINRFLCWDTNYATLDASMASDSISWKLIQYLFPAAVVYDLDFVRSDTIRLNGKKKQINKAFTSGAGCCFEVESIFFGAILFLALELYSTWNRRKSVCGLATVYGDDMIISAKAAPLAIDLLTLFGITLHPDKSHYESNDPYRETCGIEVYDGFDISCIFYPRKTVFELSRDNTINKDRSVNILAKLQQRVYAEGYHHAAMVISQIARSFKSNLRFAPEGVPHNGLSAFKVVPAVPQWYFSKKNPLLPCEMQEHLHEITVATTEAVSSDKDQLVAYNLWLYSRWVNPDPCEYIPYTTQDEGQVLIPILPDKNASYSSDNDSYNLVLTNRVVTI